MALQNISKLFSSSFMNESPLTKSLGEEFILCDNGNMVFHWADFYETCDFVRAQLGSDDALMSDFSYREKSLERLLHIPVWIRTDKKIHQTTMHELYEKYIMNQIRQIVGIDPFCPLDISFISGGGPFKLISVAECFNKTTYRDFILVYLIKGKLPRRDFRIRLKSKILMEYGKSFRNAELISLEQLTTQGMLFSMDADIYMNKVNQEKSVRFLLNLKMLADSKGMNMNELKNHLSQFAFNLLYSSTKEDAISVSLKDFSVQSGFDYSKNKKVFLFVQYDRIADINPTSIKILSEFVLHAKTLIKEHYEKDKKSA